MSPGIPLSNAMRNLIYYWFHVLKRSPEEIYESLIYTPTPASIEPIISLGHLKNICSKFRCSSDDDLHEYLMGPKCRSGGRRRRLNSLERVYLLDKARRWKCFRIFQLSAQFAEEYYSNIDDAPSVSTVYRTLRRAKLSRKVMEHRHIRLDHVTRLEYFDRIAAYDPMHLIDIDETAGSAKEFQEKYGWSDVGEACVYTQFVIAGKHYNVIAAYTPFGFLCHEVYEGSVTSDDYSDFIKNKLKPRLTNEHFAIVDNCSIHKTDKAMAAMEEAFTGNQPFQMVYVHHHYSLSSYNVGQFDFCAAYSADLKPCERGFSNVKRAIRANSRFAEANPIEAINQAFALYSVGGPRGHTGKRHY
jgi:hypothetical protein